MKFRSECEKIKRTGFLTAFILGGIFAGIVPILNMAVRSEIYTKSGARPVEVLFNANWQTMALLNILLVLEGACILYHTEYADNAMQKMCTLPFKEINLFLNKFLLILIMCAVSFAIETAAIAFCCEYWFLNSEIEVCIEILKNFGYSLFLILPAALLSLLISSLCKNMWISLGTGILCIFTATMIPPDNFVLSIFPFAMPFHILAGTKTYIVHSFIIASVVEVIIILLAELILLRVRRSFK